MSTALADNEVITAIVVPGSARGQGSAYVKFSHPASPLCRHRRGGIDPRRRPARVSGARIALGGCADRHRDRQVEKALIGTALDMPTIAAAVSKVASDLGGDVNGDIFASGEYRAAVARYT